MSEQDAVLDAIYGALERWDREERRARDLRAITKADVRRVDRTRDGARIPAPRRGALARYLTDAALTALRESASEDAHAATAEREDLRRQAIATYVATLRERIEGLGAPLYAYRPGQPLWEQHSHPDAVGLSDLLSLLDEARTAE